MNGRLYDALMGRMISADPTVPDPMNAQAWNRYSYVGNDPLAFTDPSGFSWLSNFFNSVGNFFRNLFNSVPILRSIVQLVITAVLTPIVGPFIAAAAGSAIITGLSGGNLGQMLRAGAIAAATAFAFAVVGGATNVARGGQFSLSNHTPPEFGSSAHAFNIVGHAAVGCASAAASGGSCKSGALSGAAGAAATPLVNQVFTNPKGDLGDFIGGTAATGVVGGLASVAGGGKFENGAVTAAFGYMFNEVAGQFSRRTGRLEIKNLDDGSTVSQEFLSGGMLGDEIPTGEYDILSGTVRNGSPRFRLEARDGTHGDDYQDGSGRGLFRLHGPGVSAGCITACTNEDWTPVMEMI